MPDPPTPLQKKRRRKENVPSVAFRISDVQDLRILRTWLLGNVMSRISES